MSRWNTVLPFALVVAICSTASAVDFRIDSKIFVDDGETPVYENVTLFQRGIVYDFLQTGENNTTTEITIYDPRGRHFTLLDVRRQVKTRIEEDVLLQFVAEVKVRTIERGAASVREAAEPNFNVAYDQEMKTLSLTGRKLDYLARASRDRFPDTQTSSDYFNFIDMYARLNATRVGAMPPQARLELNKALAQHEMLPGSIERTLRSRNPLLGKATIARSEHEIVWRLLRPEQNMIDKASKQQANFVAVSFGEYRKLENANGE